MKRFALALLLPAAYAAVSKKMLSKTQLEAADAARTRRLKEEFTGINCANLPGTWTGFMGSTALFDNYVVDFRGGSYPAGSFTAAYVSSPSWSLGIGQLSADNGTATVYLDSLDNSLTGTVSTDCSSIVWDNGSSWRKTSTLPKRVHMVSMNHLDVGTSTPSCVRLQPALSDPPPVTRLALIFVVLVVLLLQATTASPTPVS
jgi:hypothetical protein